MSIIKYFIISALLLHNGESLSGQGFLGVGPAIRVLWSRGLGSFLSPGARLFSYRSNGRPGGYVDQLSTKLEQPSIDQLSEVAGGSSEKHSKERMWQDPDTPMDNALTPDEVEWLDSIHAQVESQQYSTTKAPKEKKERIDYLSQFPWLK